MSNINLKQNNYQKINLLEITEARLFTLVIIFANAVGSKMADKSF